MNKNIVKTLVTIIVLFGIGYFVNNTKNENEKEPIKEAAIIAKSNITDVKWHHKYNREVNSESYDLPDILKRTMDDTTLTMKLDLDNVSGRKFDYCVVNAKIKIVFPDKTFVVNNDYQISGGNLGRLNKEPLWVSKSKSKKHITVFNFSKSKLNPEIFKHKPEAVYGTFTVTAGNSIGYSNGNGDIIFEDIKIDSWDY